MTAPTCACLLASESGLEPDPGRRRLLRAMAAVSVTGALGRPAFAAETAIPKPENVMTPEAALERLVDGNTRYMKGVMEPHQFVFDRAVIKQAQNPFACILGCADSRVSPELCFDESVGDLFVTRVAGNYVNFDILASLEYGTSVLGASLIMVLGHTRCGAIAASIDAYQNSTNFPGHIQNITSTLSAAVMSVGDESGKLDRPTLEKAVTIQNIHDNVALLRRSTPLLRQRCVQGKLMVVGGLYELDTGKVTLV
jgi:carbonic anhydrase